MRGSAQLPMALKQMGYASLRDGQEDPIINILGQRDTLCILPTGTGKTSVFVIPTLCLGWRTLVFSPLVALMRDQVQSLQRVGVTAVQMTGMQSDAENAVAARQWMAGDAQLFYVAPERLGNKLFQEAIRAYNPDMVVMDEAHTLSQWADTFRAAYMKVGDFIAAYNPKVVAAFTATCPPEVEADVRRVLGMQAATRLLHYPIRHNLKLTSRDFVGVGNIVQDILQVGGPTIVYCGTIEKVETIAEQLSAELPYQVSFFHGKLPENTKRSNMDQFMQGYARVMVATNAFGMGVDKADIRLVIHRDHPGSPEALAQETGRAGRDGNDSWCITYQSKDSLDLQHFFIRNAYPERGDIEAVFEALRRSAGPDGISHVTGEELGRLSGVRGFQVGAIMTLLNGNNVIESAKGTEKIAKIRFVGSSETTRFQDWKAKIERGGQQEDDGFISVDIDWLASEVEIGKATLVKYLREWDKEGFLRYVAPFRGTPRKIIGTPALIDYDRLEIKKNHSLRKLQAVMDYFVTPDPHKHEYLKNFCIQNV
jgi:ATP-dependent DNA helicase RecQ